MTSGTLDNARRGARVENYVLHCNSNCYARDRCISGGAENDGHENDGPNSCPAFSVNPYFSVSTRKRNVLGLRSSCKRQKTQCGMTMYVPY